LKEIFGWITGRAACSKLDHGRSGIKQRKPKDLAEKLDKSLRGRYAEVVKLRELVKKAESKVRGDGKSSADSLGRRR
jgi:hypothetical protein